MNTLPLLLVPSKAFNIDFLIVNFLIESFLSLASFKAVTITGFFYLVYDDPLIAAVFYDDNLSLLFGIIVANSKLGLFGVSTSNWRVILADFYIDNY